MVVDRFVDPELEMAEVTDRVVKSEGKALLFTNNGTSFPVLINMFGTRQRLCYALKQNELDDSCSDLQKLFDFLKNPGIKGEGPGGLVRKLKLLRSIKPVKLIRRGACQEVIFRQPDLSILPAMKCWPHDGGKFITLPIVHTKNPETGEVNAGMYRMQIFNENTTGLHWHRHKTGANHYNAWKRKGELMPVAVALGGDPVYTYSATAPLPEGVDEYMLAGFLRKERVKLVKCLTQDLWVPEDADFVIEGYVDPGEELVWEGPFGDHTGFYSLADWYPRFHVTCITHRKDAIFPATIVGVPPMEDANIGLATERLFLFPIKLTIQPDIVDIHLPTAGVAHNLVLVSINKKYPGHGTTVINALFGAGQMMLSKFIVVVDGDVNLTNYEKVISAVHMNVVPERDLIINCGALDILDHASDTFSYGGKMGIDATSKIEGEIKQPKNNGSFRERLAGKLPEDIMKSDLLGSDLSMLISGIPAIFCTVNKDKDWRESTQKLLETRKGFWIFIVDKPALSTDQFTRSWQILSNTDPARDVEIYNGNVIVDATAKVHPSDHFPRKWPNVVVSSMETIREVDKFIREIVPGNNLSSPSSRLSSFSMPGGAEVEKK